jgi:hypothetical protein
MAYMETCGDVMKGETLMQIGMGGGMKVGLGLGWGAWGVGGGAGAFWGDGEGWGDSQLRLGAPLTAAFPRRPVPSADVRQVGVNLWRALRDNRSCHPGERRAPLRPPPRLPAPRAGATAPHAAPHAAPAALCASPSPGPPPTPLSPPAWLHLKDSPLTEADLPRPIEQQQEAAGAGARADVAVASGKPPLASGKVARRPTVEVFAAEAEGAH